MKKKGFKQLAGLLLSAAMVLGILGSVPLTALADYTAPTNLPAMYITLDNGVEQSTINKDDYLPGTYSLVGAEGYDDIIDQPLEIKGRGNYSWAQEKKPYNVKFGSKVNLLGMGKSKKWCLIANYLDKTLLRNYTTMELARKMGMTETTDCRFIDLYVNGSYYGNFLITEKVEAASDRVDIETDEGSQLFEIEMAYRHTDTGCADCHETAAGVHVTYKDPEPGDFDTADEFTAKKTACDSIIDAAESSMTQGYEAYSEKIDVTSFVNWYVLSEFVKNYDSAFVTSDYFWYDAADGKLHMGPVWDYDTCYGNQDQGFDDCLYPEGYHVNEAPWYTILLKDPDFLQLVKDRWTLLRIQGVFSEFITKTMETAAQNMAASRALDEQRWPNALKVTEVRGVEKSLYTFNEEFDYMKDWIQKRTAWLDTQWNINNYAITRFCNVTSLVDTASLTGNSGINNHPIGDLFDGKTSTKYCSSNDEDGTFTFSWKMTSPCAVTTYAFATANDMQNAYRTPVSWKFYGSVDGQTWYICDEENDMPIPPTTFTYTQYTCQSSRAYTYYKVVVSKYADGNDAKFQLSEMMLGNGRQNKTEAAKNTAEKLNGLVSVELSDEARIEEAVAAWSALTENEIKYLLFNDVTGDSVTTAKEKLNALLATIIAGDVNADGSINAADALMVLQFSIYINQPENEFQFRRADVDANELLDVSDALEILQYSTGLITEF